MSKFVKFEGHIGFLVLLAINKINGTLYSTDPLFQVIHKCKEMLQRRCLCCVIHTYQEANMCAEYLVSWDCRGGIEFETLDELP